MNKKILLVISLLAASSIAAPQKGIMTDSRDGKKYKTVKIGEQTWMAENLNYEVKKSECQRCRYGRLYTWNDAQHICPDGWHLPDYGEWKKLLDYSSKKSSNDEGWINLLSKEELLVYYNIVFDGGCGHDAFGSFEEMKAYFDIKGNKDLDRSICRSGNSICLTYSQKRGRDLYGFNAQIVGLINGFEEEACDVYGYVAFWTSPDNENHFFVSNKADFLDNGDEVRSVHKFYVRCIKDSDLVVKEDNSVLSILKKANLKKDPKSTNEFVQKLTSEINMKLHSLETKESIFSNAAPQKGTMTDPRDGKQYKTVKIGEQVWMAENLNYKTDNSSCYNNSAEFCEKYGRLYKWADAVGKLESECGFGHRCSLPSGNIQGVCPSGWHLPSEMEFLKLSETVNGHWDFFSNDDKYGGRLWRSDNEDDSGQLAGKININSGIWGTEEKDQWQGVRCIKDSP
jgi:uncharacterized protein (TIGR02145 family)